MIIFYILNNIVKIKWKNSKNSQISNKILLKIYMKINFFFLRKKFSWKKKNFFNFSFSKFPPPPQNDFFLCWTFPKKNMRRWILLKKDFFSVIYTKFLIGEKDRKKVILLLFSPWDDRCLSKKTFFLSFLLKNDFFSVFFWLFSL